MEHDGSLFGDDQPCFGCGPAHPHGFRLRFEESGDELVTRFTPGELHQSAPGLMHGGLVVTLADELAAWVVIVKLGKFGFTAKLSARLQKPVRPGVLLEGRAKLVRSTTRTAEVEVALHQSGEQVYSGSFTFVLLDRAGAEKLLGRALPEAWLRFSR